MIKLNLGQMVEYPVHTSVFVMDLALLLVHRPPFLFSLALFALLLWLTMFFVVNSERSSCFRVVFERQTPPPAAVASPQPPPKAEPSVVEAAAAVEAPVEKAEPAAAAAVAEAQPAAPSRSAGTTRRSSSRKKS